MTFVELYAGLASVTLHLLGHKPPVSRVGSKAGYAAAIAECAGLKREHFDSYLLVDADRAVAATLRVLFTNHTERFRAARLLRCFKEDRATWEALRAEQNNIAAMGVSDSASDALVAARWLFVTAGSRGGVGGFKGKHKLRPSVRGFIPTIGSLADRVDGLEVPRGTQVDVRCALAGSEVVPFRDSVVYLDPPYRGRLGYGDFPDEPVEWVYRRWRAAGARVLVSEARRLDLPGARAHDITGARRGQARRSLTKSTREYLHVSAP